MENARGSGLMILSMAFFAFEDMCIKYLSQSLPVGEVVVIIGVFATLVFGTAATLKGHRPLSPSILRSRPMALRNIGEFCGTTLFTGAIAFTPLAQASAIQLATPLAVTLGAVLFMGEQVGWRRWCAITVGFIGVLIVVQPSRDGLSPYTVMAVIAIAFYAMRDLITRRVPRDIPSLTIGTLGYLTVIPSGVALLAIQGVMPHPPSAGQWLLLAMSSSLGVAGYHLLIEAMRAGDVSVIAPFRYTRLIFAICIGALVFGESIRTATLIGGALIVGSGLYSLWRETLRRRRR